MCIVSAVHDWGSQLPPEIWDWQKVNEYSEIIRRLDEIDRKLNNPPCDPNKAKFVEEIRQRLKKNDEERTALEVALKNVESV